MSVQNKGIAKEQITRKSDRETNIGTQESHLASRGSFLNLDLFRSIWIIVSVLWEMRNMWPIVFFKRSLHTTAFIKLVTPELTGRTCCKRLIWSNSIDPLGISSPSIEDYHIVEQWEPGPSLHYEKSFRERNSDDLGVWKLGLFFGEELRKWFLLKLFVLFCFK